MAASCVVPLPWNFTPMIAVALFAGARISRDWLAGLAVGGCLALGDLLLDAFAYEGFVWDHVRSALPPEKDEIRNRVASAGHQRCGIGVQVRHPRPRSGCDAAVHRVHIAAGVRHSAVDELVPIASSRSEPAERAWLCVAFAEVRVRASSTRRRGLTSEVRCVTAPQRHVSFLVAQRDVDEACALERDRLVGACGCECRQRGLGGQEVVGI
ncbi:hypothetical protein BH11MYX1_BH11MYX1_38210 [soil metagenome]